MKFLKIIILALVVAAIVPACTATKKNETTISVNPNNTVTEIPIPDEKAKLTVYSRWGQVVLETDDYNYEMQTKLEALPSGTYLFILIHKNGSKESGYYVRP